MKYSERNILQCILPFSNSESMVGKNEKNKQEKKPNIQNELKRSLVRNQQRMTIAKISLPCILKKTIHYYEFCNINHVKRIRAIVLVSASMH